MVDARSIDLLKTALRRLPGVGPKTAQRMAFHLLERDRDGAREIADALRIALDSIVHCERCNNFSETPVCPICSSERRDAAKLCIVENPADLDAIESAAFYSGMYYVLMGHLAPLDGVGPAELGVEKLTGVMRDHDISEVILATNLTVEGESTAHFLNELFASMEDVSVTRLARGVPVGGELEYMDQGTLEQAFDGRREIS